MQILIILSLMLTLVSSQAEMLAETADWTLTGSAATSAGAVAGSTLAFVLLALLYHRRIARRIDRTGQLDRRRYRRAVGRLGYLMILLFAVQVFGFRWPALLGFGQPDQAVLRADRVPVGGLLIVWLPFFVMLLGLWASAYLVDSRVRTIELRRRIELGLPVYAADGGQAVWSLRQFLNFNLRFHLLLVLLPLLAILLLEKLLTWAMARLGERLAGVLSADQISALTLAVTLAPVLGVLVLSPPALTVIFSTRPLPAGRLRERLERIIARGRTRVRRILLWNTHGMVSNAAVMGLWGRLRYVMLSDALLETLPDEQIEGVFGHELGHVVHHHILYYLLMLSAGIAWVGLLVGLAVDQSPLGRWIGQSDSLAIAVEGGLTLLLGAALLVAFGWVSRRFEWQSDLAGAQAIMLGDLAQSRLSPSAGPEEAVGSGAAVGSARSAEAAGPVVLDADRLDLDSPPHPLAGEVYAAALMRIAQINGLDAAQRNWRHGSILHRAGHVRQLCDPRRFAGFRRTIALIKLTILAAVAGVVAVAATAL